MKKAISCFIVSVCLATSSAYGADEGLIILDWSGFEDPGFFASYIEKHGDSPTFSYFGEEEEAFNKLRSGFKADLAHPCSQSVSKWVDAGVIEPFDTARIERWDEVNSEMKESFVFDGNYYLVPVDWGTTSVVYRSDEVDKADVQSLNVFLNPKFAGRISIADNVDDAYALGFLATGLSDWTQATLEDVEKASGWLRQAHQNVRTYWVDSAELSQLLASGEVLVSWAWNETPSTMAAEGLPVVANRETTEGSSTWFCGYANVANSDNPEDKLYDFINAWLEPRSAEYIVNEWGYGHGNQMAMDALGEELLAEVGLGPVAVPILHQAPMNNEIREAMIKEFELIKAGF